MAEENESKWTDFDSDSSESESSCSSSNDEEVKCLMADDAELESACEQVFDFISNDFTREERISTLHDMMNDYQRLSLSFEEVKVKQTDSLDNKTETDLKQSV